MGKKIKIFFGILICSGLTAVIVGGGVFFARNNTAQMQKKIKAFDTMPLSSFVELKDKTNIVLCAHRGLSATAPENTLQAIQKAGEANFKRVEFDIFETADGELILMHDDRIDRMTDGEGRVSSYTFDELQNFHIDNGANIDEYEEEIKIPKLSEVLQICKEYGMTPVIEIKDVGNEGIQKLKNLTDDFGEKVIVISFDGDTLKEYRELDEETEIWYLTKRLDKKAFNFADETGFSLSFNASEKENTQKVIEQAVDSGYHLTAWTVDEKDELISLVQMGVTEITTSCILPPSEKN